jgi:hypothetical protein
MGIKNISRQQAVDLVIEAFEAIPRKTIQVSTADGTLEIGLDSESLQEWCKATIGSRPVVILIDGTNLLESSEAAPGWVMRGTEITLIVLNFWVYERETRTYETHETSRKLRVIFGNVLAHELRHAYQEERMKWLVFLNGCLAGLWCAIRFPAAFASESKDGFRGILKGSFYYRRVDLLERDARRYQRKWHKDFERFLIIN